MDILDSITKLFHKYRGELTGNVSNTIPELLKVKPDLFSISVVTTTGKTYHVGDHDHRFTIQSISKPFTYGLALKQNGVDYIEEKVGVEPTGEDFDSIIKLDDRHRPFNPMVNSGAIAVTSLINPEKNLTREEALFKYYSKFTGKNLKIDNNTYQSEYNNGHKNWAIAHLLRHFKVMSQEFKNDLDLYFRQCSAEINSDELALMGATLANGGINPISKEKCIDPENLRHVLSIILTCGMYNYSGEWVFDVGLPAKSSISGGILMIIPGLMGIAVYSPRLDKRGNSVRGIKVCEDLSKMHRMHLLDNQGPSSERDLI